MAGVKRRKPEPMIKIIDEKTAFEERERIIKTSSAKSKKRDLGRLGSRMVRGLAGVSFKADINTVTLNDKQLENITAVRDELLEISIHHSFNNKVARASKKKHPELRKFRLERARSYNKAESTISEILKKHPDITFLNNIDIKCEVTKAIEGFLSSYKKRQSKLNKQQDDIKSPEEINDKSTYRAISNFITDSIKKGNQEEAEEAVKTAKEKKAITLEQEHAFTNLVKKAIKNEIRDNNKSISKQLKGLSSGLCALLNNALVNERIRKQQKLKTEKEQTLDERLRINYASVLKVIERLRYKGQIAGNNQHRYVLLLLAFLCGFRPADIVKMKVKTTQGELFAVGLAKKREGEKESECKIIIEPTITSAEEIKQLIAKAKKLITAAYKDRYILKDGSVDTVKFNELVHCELNRIVSKELANHLFKGEEKKQLGKLTEYGEEKKRKEWRGIQAKVARDISANFNYEINKARQIAQGKSYDSRAAFIMKFLRHEGGDTASNYQKAIIENLPETRTKDSELRKEVKGSEEVEQARAELNEHLYYYTKRAADIMTAQEALTEQKRIVKTTAKKQTNIVQIKKLEFVSKEIDKRIIKLKGALGVAKVISSLRKQTVLLEDLKLKKYSKECSNYYLRQFRAIDLDLLLS